MKNTIPGLFIIFLSISVWAGEKPGGYVITSDRMEGTRGGNVAVFSGNVKLLKDEVTLVSDRMENHEGEDVLLAMGNVHGVDMSKEGETTEVFCDKARYSRDMSYGVFTGEPRVIRIDLEDESKTIDISGDRIEVFEDEEKGIVKGHVVVKQEDVSATSDLLNYSSEMREIVLTEGTPGINQNNEEVEARYTARKITMFLEERTIIFEDHFNARIYIKEKNTVRNEKKYEEKE